MKKTFAKVSTSFEDLHQFKKAPGKVKFLRSLHRHRFFVIVFVEQFHNDRDVEYFLFKEWLDSVIAKKIVKMESGKSCEMMAEVLHKEISKKYKNREIRIEINEDGENGAYLEFK